MEKVKFEDLGIKFSEDTEKIIFNNKEIEIKKYLPISQRYDIIMIALQKAYEDGVYNPLKLDEYFNLNIIYSYTNIEFSDELREDEDALYDMIETSGLLNAVLLAMNKDQYQEMVNTLTEITDVKQTFENSVAGTLRKFFNEVSLNADQMQQIVDNFDKDKYLEVMNFAKAANGGRDI